MFEDLNWKGAIKRSALTVGLYLLLIYVLNIAVPGSLGSPVAIGANAVLLFVLFTVFHAYIDRRRRRREAEKRAVARGKKPPQKGKADENGEPSGPSLLKGRQNPNTSRRKASRRRR